MLQFEFESLREMESLLKKILGDNVEGTLDLMKEEEVDEEVEDEVVWNSWKIIPPSDVRHTDAIDDVASDGEDDVHDCEFGRKLDERLFLFSFLFATFGAALESKVGERGHQHDRGVRHDRLEDVLVPAGGDAKEKPG